MVKSTQPFVSDLKPKHQAVLFPSLAFFDTKRNCCRALVHGRVFIEGKVPLRTKLLLKGLKRAMQVTPEQVSSEPFRGRIGGFLAAPGKRRKIVLQVGDKNYRLLRRTRRNGAFFGTLRVPEAMSREWIESNNACTVNMFLKRTEDAEGKIAETEGKIYFVPPRGLSVVSDIDDTIKITEATSKSKMLQNTFLRPFEGIEGMAELYRDWETQGVAFHYVSSSPWQLYRPLSEFCSKTNFPEGSMHLRYFNVRDQVFKRFRLLRQNSKVGIIAGIMKRLPERKFILVGDSGEKDPEIYRFLARRFPNSVAAILIREVAERPFSVKRLKRLRSLQGQAVPHVQVFHKPDEVRDILAHAHATAGL
ncbi:MAG: App1 family protein [Pirellulaceae bacterium]